MERTEKPGKTAQIGCVRRMHGYSEQEPTACGGLDERHVGDVWVLEPLLPASCPAILIAWREIATRNLRTSPHGLWRPCLKRLLFSGLAGSLTASATGVAEAAK